MPKRVSESPEALKALVKALTDNSNPYLQTRSAEALTIVAEGGGKAGLNIANSEGALEALADSLSKDDNPTLQRFATLTLAFLPRSDGGSDGGSGLVSKICNTPGVLERLVDSLSKDWNFDLRQDGARALHELAKHGGAEEKLKILRTKGALDKLVDSLTTSHNPDLAWAQSAIASLVKGRGHKLSEDICKTDGLPEKLVHSLGKDISISRLPQQAVRLLSILAKEGGYRVALWISEIDGALKNLVDFLSKPKLKDEAAEALQVLAEEGGYRVALQIFGTDGVPEKLKEWLKDDEAIGSPLPTLARWTIYASALASGQKSSDEISNAYGLSKLSVAGLDDEADHTPYKITISVYQSVPKVYFHVVEKTVWNYADGGTWHEIDGEHVLRMGGSGTSGTLRLKSNTSADEVIFVFGVHNYRTWCDAVLGADDVTGMIVNARYYGGQSNGGTWSWTECSAMGPGGRKFTIKYTNTDGRDLHATIIIT